MAGNLSKWEVAQFKEAFALFDGKKDGTIDPDELKQVMASMGQECTNDEIKDMIDVADEFGTGRIDFPSFLKQYQHQDGEDPNELLDEAFHLVGNGNDIGPGEVTQVYIHIYHIVFCYIKLNTDVIFIYIFRNK